MRRVRLCRWLEPFGSQKRCPGCLPARAEGQKLPLDANIQYGKMAKTIRDRTEAPVADLIVLVTHGKAGTPAFWANSIAAQVREQTNRPLLLVPV